MIVRTAKQHVARLQRVTTLRSSYPSLERLHPRAKADLLHRSLNDVYFWLSTRSGPTSHVSDSRSVKASEITFLGAVIIDSKHTLCTNPGKQQGHSAPRCPATYDAKSQSGNVGIERRSERECLTGQGLDVTGDFTALEVNPNPIPY